MEAVSMELSCCSKMVSRASTGLIRASSRIRFRNFGSQLVVKASGTGGNSGGASTSYVPEEKQRAAVASEELVADLASVVSDLASLRDKFKPPPRFCTLRAFTKLDEVPASSSKPDSVFFRPLAASVQATAQARDFETLSGRFSMIAFAVALGIEYITGNSLFNNLDPKQLADFLVLVLTSMLTITSFAAAWLTKKEISLYMARGCKDIVDSALSDIVDGLFYDDEA